MNEPIEWEYATTQGPRKMWDKENVPPDGEGWVRDIEKGRNGWERFDYYEEAYWKRPIALAIHCQRCGRDRALCDGLCDDCTLKQYGMLIPWMK